MSCPASSWQGFLANHNVLPKYGFPVDSVERTNFGYGKDAGSMLDLSRDLSQAIYEYAPDAHHPRVRLRRWS